ncbi:MAG TPA: 50S ribosomal protein L18 [Polyangia bacterium]|nr:50S ribosomal protein L18 [Polyangia bacterium]
MLTNIKYKSEARKKRHRSLRKRVIGTAERPRLAVFRSAKHIYAQVIDDEQKKTIVATSDQKVDKSAAPAAKEGGKDGAKVGAKKARAKQVGTLIAQKCKEKGIEQVVFDRAGYKYHGRVSALAEGAREAGLKF